MRIYKGATDSEGFLHICRIFRRVVANTWNEKEENPLPPRKTVINLQYRKDKNTIHLINNNLKKYNYEKEFNDGKAGAHEHHYRRHFHIRFHRL